MMYRLWRLAEMRALGIFSRMLAVLSKQSFAVPYVLACTSDTLYGTDRTGRPTTELFHRSARQDAVSSGAVADAFRLACRVLSSTLDDVDMLTPYNGRVYGPCCGSGGMFVQSEKFIEAQATSLATSPFAARSPTTPRGGWQR